MLFDQLSKRGKSVLIFDDVWEHFDLDEVGIPVEADGLKLVLTTRSFEELGPEALSLEIEAVTKLIVEECAGLPLGIVMMARTMRGVSDLFEWKDILERLKESNMGQMGLIGGLDKRDKCYDRGLTIMNKLENVFLLENDRGMVKMHDLIRDMALHVMSATSMVKAGKGLTRILSEECWMDGVEKVSFMENYIRVIPSNMSPNYPKLATLLLNGSLWGNVLIPNSFFKRLEGLKVLNLSGCGIRELPNSISDLIFERSGGLGNVGKLEMPRLIQIRAGGESNEDSMLIAQDVQRLVGKKCGGMTNLSNIGPLESLKVLIMEEWENLQTLCGGVDEVIDNHDFPLLFPSLKMLTVERCPKLKFRFGNRSKVTLSHLQQIVIKNCEELQGITAAGAIFATPLPAFPNLEKIVIEHCANMKSVVEFELLPHLPNLDRLQYSICEKMEEILGRAPQTMPSGALSLLTFVWIE
ncbi:probable disease resistance protein At4g27220 [Eucalyptus grandis]|uniref:probable disease resistance protein At4g27220 n=1 Tax=Eucalyptus grandis TaxID=71139 RepID=UPI00192E8F1A|nr:probable disease resistance protein At4g27220 [Eucalyptus grandis]